MRSNGMCLSVLTHAQTLPYAGRASVRTAHCVCVDTAVHRLTADFKFYFLSYEIVTKEEKTSVLSHKFN